MIRANTLTANQLAERWKGVISKRTIDDWRQKGRGPKYFKIGKSKTCLVLYKLSDVKKFEKGYFNGGYRRWQK